MLIWKIFSNRISNHEGSKIFCNSSTVYCMISLFETSNDRLRAERRKRCEQTRVLDSTNYNVIPSSQHSRGDQCCNKNMQGENNGKPVKIDMMFFFYQPQIHCVNSNHQFVKNTKLMKTSSRIPKFILLFSRQYGVKQATVHLQGRI